MNLAPIFQCGELPKKAENHISVSIVLYRPKLSVIGKVLSCLNDAKKELAIHYPEYQVSVHLVENQATSEESRSIAKFLGETADIGALDFVEALANTENSGYGRGNNIAIERTGAAYHLVLNPDVFVSVDFFKNALSFMRENSEVGLLSPSVFGEDGERHYLCKQNPTFFIFFLRSFAPGFLRRKFASFIDMYEMRYADYGNEIRNIPYLSGCCMFFRGSVLRSLGGFDSRYFLYSEDADITREVLRVAQTAYVPSVKVVHQWARGTHSSFKLKMVTVYAALQYFWKWRFQNGARA